MPLTPMAKGGVSDDSTRGFASQEAVTALAETLAKRDAEVSLSITSWADHVVSVVS